jgi:ATP-dependent DNA helicase RecG
MPLFQSCEILPGVGPALTQKLNKCGIKTIADLLFHLPFRYQDRTHLTPIQDLRANDHAVIAGRICKTEINMGKRPMLYCYVEDKTGIIKLRFFHFHKQQVQTMKSSPWIRAFGEVKQFAGQSEMIHPEYQLLQNEFDVVVEEALTPIYPGTEGLSQTRLRQLIKISLEKYATELHILEWMSAAQLQELQFPTLAEAIYTLHNPLAHISKLSLETRQHPAMKRIIFDELLAHRVSIQFARQHRAQLSAPAFPNETKLHNQLLNQLPFELTAAQLRVAEEIAQDLRQAKPMLRLIQGDVGCGKTTVAALAALQAIAAGYQVALMVPTDLLSEQHFYNLQKWLAPIGIICCRLSGKMKAKEKKEILEQLLKNECQLLIGTHALFQEPVEFANLGLIIIDEQHRFGVEQRLLLQQKGQKNQLIPHQLLMTATPIPRTLAMTNFAHLDISVIDELPPGRTPINTAVLHQDKRDPIITRLQTAIEQGKQAYWVCTLIEESEKLQSMAATVTAELLQNQLPKAHVGLVHGRMSAKEKEAAMHAFKQGDLDLLVATTVIEVGVDVPNASLMIIENAERLGLSQLHQLRGRVGRGNIQSHCLLLYQSPLSFQASERLKIMKNTSDGFIIAEKDLQLRGSGEILGTKQTGYKQLKIADFQKDHDMIPQASTIAKDLFLKTPDLALTIAKRWLGEFEVFVLC